MDTQVTHGARVLASVHRRMQIIAAVDGITVQAAYERALDEWADVWDLAHAGEVTTASAAL